MKTAIILETDNLGISASDLLDPKEMKLIGIGNRDSDTWNVFADIETGELKDKIEGLPIMPIDLAAAFQPDVMVIAAADDDKAAALRYMAIRAGFENNIVFMNELSRQFSVRGSVIRRISRRISRLGLEGSVAELGCGQGDTSWQLNALYPDRTLYLFDTMNGPDRRDVLKEESLGFSTGNAQNAEKINEEQLMSRLPNAENVVLKKGWFPETAFDLENEKFAFAMIDAGMYQPTLAGLEFFFPRMVQGGMILIVGYDSVSNPSAARAAADFEEKYGAFLIVPMGNMNGDALIVRP